jgi:plasmid stabilization system protein ParE
MSGGYRIQYSKRSIQDIKSIHKHIGKSSPAGAISMAQQIVDGIDTLAALPHRTVVAGRKSSGLPVHSLPVPPYMVYFRVRDDIQLVRILRVRHGARRELKRFD